MAESPDLAFSLLVGASVDLGLLPLEGELAPAVRRVRFRAAGALPRRDSLRVSLYVKAASFPSC